MQLAYEKKRLQFDNQMFTSTILDYKKSLIFQILFIFCFFFFVRKGYCLTYDNGIKNEG